MKRTELARRSELRNKTPLARKTELVNRTPLVSQSLPLARKAMVRTVKRTGPVTSVRALVFARDGGRCIRCGAEATNLHHRQNRGVGGSNDPAINSPANLLAVCGSGTTGCHGWMESNRLDASAFGWIVRRPYDPAKVPALLRGIGLVHLTADGLRVPIGAAA